MSQFIFLNLLVLHQLHISAILTHFIVSFEIFAMIYCNATVPLPVGHNAFYTFVKKKNTFYFKYLLLVLLIGVGIFISFKLIQMHSYNQLYLLIFIESLINLLTLPSKMDEKSISTAFLSVQAKTNGFVVKLGFLALC